MTVRKLIELLEQENPEKRVLIPSIFGGMTEPLSLRDGGKDDEIIISEYEPEAYENGRG